MIITSDESLRSFQFWSGAKDTVADLTWSQVDTIESMLEDLYPEGMTDTQVNDFFWFERDTIAEWLGYRDYDHLMGWDEEDDDEEDED